MYKICMPINTSRGTQPHALCVLSYIRRSRIIIALYKRLIEWHHPIYSIPSNVNDFKFCVEATIYVLFSLSCLLLSLMSHSQSIYTNSGVIPPQMEWQTTFDKCSLLSRSMMENKNVSSKMSFLLCFFSLRYVSSQHQRYITCSYSLNKPSHTSCRYAKIFYNYNGAGLTEPFYFG